MNYYTHPHYLQNRSYGLCPYHQSKYGYGGPVDWHEIELECDILHITKDECAKKTTFDKKGESHTGGEFTAGTFWNNCEVCKLVGLRSGTATGIDETGELIGTTVTSATDLKLLSNISSAKIKDEGGMNSFVAAVKSAAKAESGQGVTISVSVPANADSWDNIKKYAAAIKKVKAALGNASKTAGAVTSAAGWFWTNVEKPAMPKGAKSASGSGATSSSSGNPYKNVPTHYSAFAVTPFWRKNNLWMYSAIAAGVGIGLWVWSRE